MEMVEHTDGLQAGQDDRLQGVGETISSLLDSLSASGPVVHERAEALVREVTALYGAGLEHLLGILESTGKLDDALVAELARDELVSGLLVVHGLHPQNVDARVAGALESVRPYLGSHGGDVELVGIEDDGAVRLRMLGTCQGCPSSSVTLKLAVESAITAAAPEVTSILVEEAKKPSVIPVEALRLRIDHPDGSVAEAGAGAWEAVPEFAELQPGEVGGFEVQGHSLIVCRTNQGLYAFRARCPRCTSDLTGASLQRALASPADGALLRCPACRSHYDVRQAGLCIEDHELHLDPFPLLVRKGVLSIALPAGAGPKEPAGSGREEMV